MSGHLLSLSRCLLNCKKENRGEYLEEYLLKILESQKAKITQKSQFIQLSQASHLWLTSHPSQKLKEKKKEERIAQTWPFWQGLNGWWKGRN